jgi:hypothetical protein
MVFGVAFMLASFGFWHLGKTDIARAYIAPTLVAGLMLLTIGLGLFFTNKARITQFETAYKTNVSTFVASEIVRAENTLKEYSIIVFKVIPIIIIVAAILIIFVNTPTWRAISITTIAMLIVILLIDGTAQARIDAYKKQLDATHQKLDF